MNLKDFVGRKVRVSLEIGGCKFGKIISVEHGLFGEEQVVLVEVEDALKAVKSELYQGHGVSLALKTAHNGFNAKYRAVLYEGENVFQEW